MIRVLQLGSPTGLYGAERWILALIKHLSPEAVESIVGVIKDDPTLEAPLCREARKLGFRTHVIEAHGKVNFSAIRRLREFIRNNDIHILHTHGYKTDLAGLLAIRGMSCKIVSTPHGWSEQADFKLQCYELLDRLGLLLMDAVVPLSKKLFIELKCIPGFDGTLKFIQNGVDLSEIDFHTHIPKELLEWKQQGAFILGYVGQLIPRKGLNTLIRAVSKLQSLDCRLAIIGDGESKPRLQRLVQDLRCNDRIVFFGFREDRLSFLRGFDAFVLPSHLEGIPRCLMEAMAAGVPVISSNIPGSRDLVTHGHTGLLFPVDDHEALMDAITSLATTQVLSQDLTKHAHELIASQFSATRMAMDYQKLFFRLAEDLR